MGYGEELGYGHCRDGEMKETLTRKICSRSRVIVWRLNSG